MKTLLHKMTGRATVFLRSEDGPTVAEYAVMMALLLFVIIASAKTLAAAALALFLSYDWV